MSKAEERASKLYPYENGVKGLICENSRQLFIQGYEQAEKDLGWEVNHREEAYTKGFSDGLKERLTWEDVRKIVVLSEDVFEEGNNLSVQEFYEEVLKRYLEAKK